MEDLEAHLAMLRGTLAKEQAERKAAEGEIALARQRLEAVEHTLGMRK